MATSYRTSSWSLDPPLGWTVEEHEEYISLTPPSHDAELRLTSFSVQDTGIDAARWIETAANANRRMGRPVATAVYGDFSGYSTEFTAIGKWFKGWVLRADTFPLDVTYTCAAALVGRDEADVAATLKTLRFHRAAV